ncbi:MAG: PQQ-dependent sugar dehydrogenase [Planctomycetes bacterium]|nr:PQQ-dependent sugar dehydrogenase [Planctomycetota bacterium]
MASHSVNRGVRLLPALVVFAICPMAAHSQTLTDPTVEIQTIINTDISLPTGIAFLGFNEFLLIEKSTGRVKHIVDGQLVATVLDLPVNPDSERGLLGITLHPDFELNSSVYLYYSRAESDGASWIENRVSRFTWTGVDLIDETLIISFPFDATQVNGPNHDGGIILFGPDGKLYGITGDLNRNRLEQNQSASAIAGVGGVFRLNDDGSTPADNPFFAHANASIRQLYAYGIRNSFGLTFDPQTGNFWDTENGPSSYDEVNLVPPGFNSGWSRIMGPDSRDPENIEDLIQIPGSNYVDPKLSFLAPVAVTALAFIDGDIMPPSWQNTLVMGDANTGNFYRFTLNAARDTIVLTGDVADLVADTVAERNSLRIGSSFGVSTDLEIGPDGSLYQVSLSGAVRRIGPVRTPGDLDCNGSVTLDDLLPFSQALTAPLEFIGDNPACDIWRADVNSDGAINALDIAPMVTLILNS